MKAARVLGMGFLALFLAAGRALTAARGSLDAFLEDGIGARAQGMSNAQAAFSEDLEMLHWNPAGLRPENPAGFTAYLSPDPSEGGSAFAAAGRRLGPVFAAAGWLQNSAPDLDVTDAGGNVLSSQDFTQEAFWLAVGAGESRFGLPQGASLKYVKRRFHPYKVDGLGFDLGWQLHWRGFRGGIKWQDVGGTALQGDGFTGGSTARSIPSRLRLGFAYLEEPGPAFQRPGPVPANRSLGITYNAAVDALAPLQSSGEKLEFFYGGELWFHRKVGLRTGWNQSRGFSLGGTLRTGGWSFDYAYRLQEDLPGLQRFSTTYRWGPVR